MLLLGAAGAGVEVAGVELEAPFDEPPSEDELLELSLDFEATGFGLE